ncbi:MAG: hypothetical protein HQL52_02625 [Magnetococcales bacterium]|nr:hypothetical protein [Magnetococcales bacterium]
MSERPPSSPLEKEYVATKQRGFKAAVNRCNRDLASRGGESHLFGYLFAWNWLTTHVHENYRQEVAGLSRNPEHHYLIPLLLKTATPGQFVRRYLEHWLQQEDPDPRIEEVRQWLVHHDGDPAKTTQGILTAWRELGYFKEPFQSAVRRSQKEQKNIFREILGSQDQERLTLIDALPAPLDPPLPFAKLGLIPAMACTQGCRHCMFVWRPPLKEHPDPSPLMTWVNTLTENVLFTGGDLTGELAGFEKAVRTMDRITTFAILLNGAFADTIGHTQEIFAALQQAIQSRPAHFAPATVALQISFDEFHQEITANRKGVLKEKIPVSHIANIVQCAPLYPQVRVSLLHKQNLLNFSNDLFRKGVFARLARELGQRGLQIQVLSTAPSQRQKAHPTDPSHQGAVLRDAIFVLTSHPDSPIHLMSSTIDAYGRAAFLDPSEYVAEKIWLEEILSRGGGAQEPFDTDLMVRHDGLVTLFSAIHIALGNVLNETPEVVLARHRKDPLLRALEKFDARLLDLYGEVKEDLQERVAKATGPHHLFHQLTERAEVRLHMTRRLLETEHADSQPPS